MSPHTAKVLEFKVDSQATVFYLDDLGRLFKNKIKMLRKPVKVKAFKLNSRGQIAYLTDGISRNPFFEDRNLSAGSHRVLDFSFTGTGEVIYKDAIGRLWKMGQLISDIPASPQLASKLEPESSQQSSPPSELQSGPPTLQHARLGNMTGHPAICLPCGFSTGPPKLPIGIMLYARAFDESSLFRAGHAYQAVTQWHRQRPPI